MPSKASTAASAVSASAGGVASVDRALSLLDAFSVARPALSLSDLAEHTQQYKSTALRMLASLEAAHLVRRHADGRFTLGSAVARLNAIYSSSFSIGEIVLPALHELVQATRESAAFHVRQGEQELCLHRVDSPHTVRDHTRAGDLRPLARSIPGRVLLAYASKGGVRAARIRREQLLIADGDMVPELAGIVAPVFAPDGALAGVVALTMPSLRRVPAHTGAVQAMARRITAQIGGAWPEPR